MTSTRNAVWVTVWLVLVAPAFALAEDKGLISDATELGGRAGAMSYCKDHHGGDDEGKYNLLAISTLKDLDELDSGDKAKALLWQVV